MNSKERLYFIAKSRAKKATEKAQAESDNYQSFTAYLQSKNLTAKNVNRYQVQAEEFKKWLQTSKDKAPEQTQKKDILAYLQYLQEKNLSNRSRICKLGILRHYYTFLYQSGHIANNPTTLIKLRGAKKKILPKVLSVNEMNELLDVHYQLKVRHSNQGKTNNKGQFQSSKHIHQRNQLILSLYIHQGLKREELLTLTINDINLQQATVNVQAGHKRNSRKLPLHATQIATFYEYLNNVRPLFKNENGLLINSKPELQKLAITLRKIYPKFTELKQLRASAITHWLQTEGLRKAQYKAGHRYTSSTEEYLANDMESLQDDITKYHPL